MAAGDNAAIGGSVGIGASLGAGVSVGASDGGCGLTVTHPQTASANAATPSIVERIGAGCYQPRCRRKLRPRAVLGSIFMTVSAR